jgi:hypothetical protein
MLEWFHAKAMISARCVEGCVEGLNNKLKAITRWALFPNRELAKFFGRGLDEAYFLASANSPIDAVRGSGRI